VRVLVAGANGFIGARVTAALRDAGHDVIAAVRHAPVIAGVACVECDFSRDTDADIWKPRLDGIDAVVNCAGILRETRSDTFQRVHVDAPLALFRACAATGVRRVIQLSALGEAEDGEFVASKHRCDHALAQLDLDWLVLRPGLVYSALGAYGGTRLLRALAAMPGLLALPNGGVQKIRPIALGDLASAIVAALDKPDPNRAIVELVGPEELTLRDYLMAWRRWFGLRAGRVVRLPHWTSTAAVAVGEAWGHGPLCRVIGNLLERERTGRTDALARTQALLGRAPTTLAQSLAERPGDARDFLEARWYLARPLLLAALAIVWIASGVVGFAMPDSAAQAALPNWPSTLIRTATWASSAADLILGVALLSGWRTRRVLALMLTMVVAYTLVIGILAPVHWLDPFGGMLKNLAVAASLVALLLLDGDRR
jgi:uncharacterized protein YbjT (DUF2867 family)